MSRRWTPPLPSAAQRQLSWRCETGRGGVWRAGGAAGIWCGLLSSPCPPLSSLLSHNPLLPQWWWRWRQDSLGRAQARRSGGELEAELGLVVEVGGGASVVPALLGWRSEVSVTEDKDEEETSKTAAKTSYSRVHLLQL